MICQILSYNHADWNSNGLIRVDSRVSVSKHLYFHFPFLFLIQTLVMKSYICHTFIKPTFNNMIIMHRVKYLDGLCIYGTLQFPHSRHTSKYPLGSQNQVAQCSLRNSPHISPYPRTFSRKLRGSCWDPIVLTDRPQSLSSFMSNHGTFMAQKALISQLGFDSGYGNSD